MPIRQQVIAWTNDDQILQRQVASLEWVNWLFVYIMKIILINPHEDRLHRTGGQYSGDGALTHCTHHDIFALLIICP